MHSAKNVCTDKLGIKTENHTKYIADKRERVREREGKPS